MALENMVVNESGLNKSSGWGVCAEFRFASQFANTSFLTTNNSSTNVASGAHWWHWKQERKGLDKIVWVGRLWQIPCRLTIIDMSGDTWPHWCEKSTFLLLLITLISSIDVLAKEFITTWQTTTANEPITIPTTEKGYAYSVNWGDGTTEDDLKYRVHLNEQGAKKLADGIVAHYKNSLND